MAATLTNRGATREELRRQLIVPPKDPRADWPRKRLLKSKVWQDWFTGAGDDADYEIIQDSALWLDLLGVVAIKVKLELIYSNHATTELKFETSNSPTGPWTELNQAAEFSTASTYIITFSSESEDESFPLRRFLRWKATGSQASWSICFYLTYEILTNR